MTKHDLIKAAAVRAGVTQRCAEAVINAAIDAATEALINSEPVKIQSCGVFEKRQRAARKTFNFHTGQPINTAASMTVHFKPADELKRRVNE